MNLYAVATLVSDNKHTFLDVYTILADSIAEARGCVDIDLVEKFPPRLGWRIVAVQVKPVPMRQIARVMNIAVKPDSNEDTLPASPTEI